MFKSDDKYQIISNIFVSEVESDLKSWRFCSILLPNVSPSPVRDEGVSWQRLDVPGLGQGGVPLGDVVNVHDPGLQGLRGDVDGGFKEPDLPAVLPTWQLWQLVWQLSDSLPAVLP